MRTPWSISLIVGLCISLFPTDAAAQMKSPEPNPLHPPLQVNVKNDEVIARLERSIPRLMEAGNVPGLSIALIRDAELVWHKGFGVRNTATKSPVTDDTVFEAASLSKPVFAYAVLKLVDSGDLDLDTPFTKYLPGSYDVGDDLRLSQITARHVLSHTTGFPNWRPRGDTTLKIHFTPGERFSYSGEGYVYLSKVVTHLTSEKFDAFMKRMVFDPLGMRSSSYVWQDHYDALKIFNHNLLGEPTGQKRVTEASAASSLNTTARDYGLFMAALLKGTGLKKETARLMLTPQVKVGRGRDTTNRPAGPRSPSISWGLGWGLQSTADGTSLWHWGDNVDNKSYVVVFDKQKMGIVVFTNSINGLSIIHEVIEQSVGGFHPALDWLNYESYRSPSQTLARSIRTKGVKQALAEYRGGRTGRPADELINEAQMNRLGYMLFRGTKRLEDAIEIFKQNVQDHPESSNVYDILGEAYMVSGIKELAIKNYQRSIELNPNNTSGREMLKKLQKVP
jgi:CubicO group peptidase (beta-lactamase class C family)